MGISTPRKERRNSKHRPPRLFPINFTAVRMVREKSHTERAAMPNSKKTVRIVSKGISEFPPPRQSPGEGDFIDIFQIAADGHPLSDAGHRNAQRF